MQLSKILASQLSPIVDLTDSHVWNSQKFGQFVTTQKVPDTEVLVSFDVASPIPVNQPPVASRLSVIS